jgi:hypothetical protein
MEVAQMKRLFLLAPLCVAAFLIAPLASANAESLVGTCVIKGTAKFSKKLPFNLPEHIEYHFLSAAEGGVECEGVNETGEKAKATGDAEVLGLGKIACVVGDGVGITGEAHGKAKILILFEVLGKKFHVTAEGEFTFIATVGVPFTALGENLKAAGLANFATPGTQEQKEKTIEECKKGELEELKFDAVATGKIG